MSYCDLWEIEREDMEDEIARTAGTAGMKVGIMKNKQTHFEQDSVSTPFHFTHTVSHECMFRLGGWGRDV